MIIKEIIMCFEHSLIIEKILGKISEKKIPVSNWGATIYNRRGEAAIDETYHQKIEANYIGRI